MNKTSWGNYPKISNEPFSFQSKSELAAQLIELGPEKICYGNGRSYGDSALNNELLCSEKYDYFLTFDSKSGILHTRSGAMLSHILEAFVSRGWFLSVTPGTQFVTVGGAIASDVHGKNHHVSGSFSSCVNELELMLPSGEILLCSPQKNVDWFNATCGGMGLTGVILSAKIQLKPISSSVIEQTTIKTQNLSETFEAFKEYESTTYSVAWIDCLAKGDSLGRSLLMVGEHQENGKLHYDSAQKYYVPFNFPSFSLNKHSVAAFNHFYYGKARGGVSQQQVSLNSFFYPLDAVRDWNRIYGRKGFTQYQFVLPEETSFEGLRQILERIALSGKGSFLAVLKLFGEGNDNWLSFPRKGYTLALDFSIDSKVFSLLNELDAIVADHGGRIYLAKDCRVSKEIFDRGYQYADRFREFRLENGLDKAFNSLQSRRLGL